MSLARASSKKNGLTRFQQNCASLFETGRPGPCPFCGGDSVDAEEIVHDRHYGVFFRCGDCGQMAHFDGRIDPDDPNWHRNKKK